MSQSTKSTPKSDSPVLGRRGWFAAAGAVGAVAAVAAAVPAVTGFEQTADVKRPEPPQRGGGYQVSEHVKRYYRTTRV